VGELFEQIYLAIVGLLSLAFFAALASRILHSSNSRWHEYEQRYAATETRVPIARKLAGAVRITQPGFRWGHLSGDLKSRRHPPVVVGVHQDGLSLSITPPFKHGCRDLFLPFGRMTIQPAAWDLSSDAYGVRMDGVDGIEIQMFSTVLHWAAERSDSLALMLHRADAMRGPAAQGGQP